MEMFLVHYFKESFWAYIVIKELSRNKAERYNFYLYNPLPNSFILTPSLTPIC
jgi:hypothetical protein